MSFISLICGVAALAQLNGHVDNSPAVVSAEKRLEEILRAVDVPGPYRVKESTPLGGAPGCAYVVLSDGKGLLHSCNIGDRTGPGRRISITARSEDEFQDVYPRGPYHNAQIERRVRVWASRLAGKEAARLDDLYIDHNGKRATAYISLMENGYSFLGGPSDFGYTVFFTVQDMRLISMEGMERPPAVDRAKPALKTVDQAVQRARLLLGSILAETKRTFTMVGTGRLGYYRLPAPMPARLVWQIPFNLHYPPNTSTAPQVSTAHAVNGRPMIYIDAVTGKLVKAFDGYRDEL